MDRQTFADVDPETGWWLTKPDAPPEVVELRTEIGQHLGFDEGWHADPDKLGELYDHLESRGGDVFAEIEAGVLAETEPDKRLEWLHTVQGAVTAEPESRPDGEAGPPAKAEAPATSAAPETADAPAAPAADAPAAPPSGGEAAPAAEHGGDGGDQSAAEPPAGAAAPAAGGHPPEGVSWNAGLGMFVKVDGGTMQFSLSTVLADGPHTEAPAGTADGNWRSDREEVHHARNEMKELKTQLSAIAADAETSVTPEQLDELLADPAFKERIEKAASDLDAELAALEGD